MTNNADTKTAAILELAPNAFVHPKIKPDMQMYFLIVRNGTYVPNARAKAEKVDLDAIADENERFIAARMYAARAPQVDLATGKRAKTLAKGDKPTVAQGCKVGFDTSAGEAVEVRFTSSCMVGTRVEFKALPSTSFAVAVKAAKETEHAVMLTFTPAAGAAAAATPVKAKKARAAK